MHRRFGLIGLLVLSLVAVLPATTTEAASGYTYTIMANRCQGSGEYTPYFKVKETAKGWTSANKLTIDSYAQRRNLGGSWFRVHTWNQARYTFSANGQTHWLWSSRSYAGNSYQYTRIVMYLRVWHSGSILASKVLHSFAC